VDPHHRGSDVTTTGRYTVKTTGLKLNPRKSLTSTDLSASTAVGGATANTTNSGGNSQQSQQQGAAGAGAGGSNSLGSSVGSSLASGTGATSPKS
jgi:hypothetical protein